MSSELCVTKIGELHKNQHNPHHFCHTKLERPYLYSYSHCSTIFQYTYTYNLGILLYRCIWRRGRRPGTRCAADEIIFCRCTCMRLHLPYVLINYNNILLCVNWSIRVIKYVKWKKGEKRSCRVIICIKTIITDSSVGRWGWCRSDGLLTWNRRKKKPKH